MSNYDVVILNMLKEKSLSRQSRERVFWQLLVDSYEMEIESAEKSCTDYFEDMEFCLLFKIFS